MPTRAGTATRIVDPADASDAAFAVSPNRPSGIRTDLGSTSSQPSPFLSSRPFKPGPLCASLADSAIEAKGMPTAAHHVAVSAFAQDGVLAAGRGTPAQGAVRLDEGARQKAGIARVHGLVDKLMGEEGGGKGGGRSRHERARWEVHQKKKQHKPSAQIFERVPLSGSACARVRVRK